MINLPPSVPFFPSEDSKLRATSLTTRRGGNCPNTLEVLQQLLLSHQQGVDIKPYLVSCLPGEDSPATRRIIDSFGPDSPVDLRHCIYRPGHAEAASSYIIRSEQSGSRTLVNYNDLPEMTAAEFERVARSFGADQETWWHFEVRDCSPFPLPSRRDRPPFVFFVFFIFLLSQGPSHLTRPSDAIWCRVGYRTQRWTASGFFAEYTPGHRLASRWRSRVEKA